MAKSKSKKNKPFARKNDYQAVSLNTGYAAGSVDLWASDGRQTTYVELTEAEAKALSKDLLKVLKKSKKNTEKGCW